MRGGAGGNIARHARHTASAAAPTRVDEAQQECLQHGYVRHVGGAGVGRKAGVHAAASEAEQDHQADFVAIDAADHHNLNQQITDRGRRS